MPSAVFRVDAGPGIGNGHVARCMALAEELRRVGWRCRLAGNADAAALASDVAGDAMETLVLDDHGDPAEVFEPLAGEADVVVIDHYGLDASFESGCRAAGATTVATFDDHATQPHDCDVLISPAPGRRGADYDGLLAPRCRVLAGPDYAPIRGEFFRLRHEMLGARGECTGTRLLVGFGGQDGRRLTAPVLDRALRVGDDLAIDVVLGDTAEREEVEQICRRHPDRARLHVDSPCVAQLMADADLAAGAGGVMAMERCVLGLPSITVETAANQRAGLRALAEREAVLHLGSWQGVEVEAFGRALAELRSDGGRMSMLAQNAAGVCDGLGARRLAAGLAPELDGRGRACTTRRVHEADMEVLLAWQQAPKTRQYFRNPMVPGRDEHVAWFERRRQGLHGLFEVVTCEGRPAAVLHAEWQPTSGRFGVSIVVDPAARGMGIGTAALRLLCRLLPEAALAAEIHHCNDASHNAFLRVGFAPSQREGNFVQYLKRR